MDSKKVMQGIEDFAKTVASKSEVSASPRSISSYASKAIYYLI